MSKCVKGPPLFFLQLLSIKKIMLAMVTPITSRVRGHGFEVPFKGKKIKGVVLCQQVKMIDFIERGVQFAEKAPDTVTSDALARVRAIVSE
jgi:mRNA interferase MazF